MRKALPFYFGSSTHEFSTWRSGIFLETISKCFVKGRFFLHPVPTFRLTIEWWILRYSEIFEKESGKYFDFLDFDSLLFGCQVLLDGNIIAEREDERKDF